MRDRLELSDVDLLRSILVVLDTRSWLLRELPVHLCINLQKNSIRSYVTPVYRLQAEC